jgi:hypothetical protein
VVAIVLFALVAFECWGSGSTGKWCGTRLSDQVWDLRGQIGEQRRYSLISYQRVCVVVTSYSGNDEGKALNGGQKPFEVAILVWVFAVARGRKLH